MFRPKCLLSWVAALAIPVSINSAPASAQAYAHLPDNNLSIDGQNLEVKSYQISVVRNPLPGGLIYANELTVTIPAPSRAGQDALESEVGGDLSELKLTTYSFSDVPNTIIKTVQTFKRSSERAASFEDGSGTLTFYFYDFTTTTTSFTCDNRYNGVCTSAGN